MAACGVSGHINVLRIAAIGSNIAIDPRHGSTRMLNHLVDGIVRRKTIIDGDSEDTGIINCWRSKTSDVLAASTPTTAVNIYEKG